MIYSFFSANEFKCDHDAIITDKNDAAINTGVLDRRAFPQIYLCSGISVRVT